MRKEVPGGTSFTLYFLIKVYNSTHKVRKFVRVFIAKFVFLCYNKCEHIKCEIVCEF